MLSAGPVRAARPLLDLGKWDAYFALFARDTQVPWKRISVRLDTYSGAPVDFAAYDVDPADVLVASAGARSRAIDTAHRTPVAKWRFTPPPGQAFESNDVDVPLANREGFYVIEARRGDAVQQVWLNLSRIGLLTKESPGGIVLYSADLGTGKALAGMRITYLVGTKFVYGKTDAQGIAHGPAGARPRFALADWGRSKAFVTFVPTSPIPSALVGVRLERGVVRAGERVRAVGFVRKRSGTTMKPGAGEVKITIATRGKTLALENAKLDAAGAFTGDLAIPADAAAGDAAVLASSNGATGGAVLHIDGVADAVLSIANACGASCAPDAEVPLTIAARRAGSALPHVDVRVRVVRTPHILAPGTPPSSPEWATTTIVDRTQRTDDLGLVHVTLPAPTDGLASTYGVDVSSGASSATARIVTPTAKIALSVQPERTQIDLGEAATVLVRGFDAVDGTPAAGLAVNVHLVHGPNAVDQAIKLDAAGRGSVVFRNLIPGTSLVSADAQVDGRRAYDVAAISAVPSALAGTASRRSNEIAVTFDKVRYHVGDRVAVSASLAGAVGDAFVSLEGARPFATQTIGVQSGKANASLTVPETVGDAYVGVAFVRDGAMYYATERLVIDGPGHPRMTALTADKPVYAPGAIARIAIADGNARDGATIAVRLADGAAASGAAFGDAPEVLATSGTTSQNPASDDPAWHAWVAPARSTAGDIFGFDRARPAAVPDAALAASVPQAFVWRVGRSEGDHLDVTLPTAPGKYVFSLLKIADDGDVGAATLTLVVQ